MRRISSLHVGAPVDRPMKFLSHFGAVRVRESGARKIDSSFLWLDTEAGMGYIDVMNYNYSLVLDWIWPGALASVNITNIKTKGDIVEGLLGWYFLRQKSGLGCSALATQSVLDLDCVLWWVYRNPLHFEM